MLGVLYAVSAIIYSVYIIVGGGVMKRVSGAILAGHLHLRGRGLRDVDSDQRRAFPQSSSGWWFMAGIVVIATAIPVTTFLAGLERIGPTNASLLSTLEPVVTVLLAAWLFGDVSPITLVGGALILVAVVVLTRSEMN